MSPDDLKWAVGQGGFALAFVVLFHFYRKDIKSYTDLWQATTKELMQLTKDNTTSNTLNTASNMQLINVVNQLETRLLDIRPGGRRHTDMADTPPGKIRGGP